MNKKPILSVFLAVAVFAMVFGVPTAQASCFGGCYSYTNTYTNTAPVNNPYSSPNRAPVWTNNETQYTVNAGNLLRFYIGAYDPDNDAVSVFASFLPTGASYNSFTQAFEWTPASYQVATYNVRFTATDGKLYSYKDVTIVVQPGQTAPAPINNPNPTSPVTPPVVQQNRAPQFLNFVPPGTTKVGQLYSYDVNATDADGDTLFYSLNSNPSGMFINSVSGLITWVPTAAQTGFQYVQVAVSDGKAQSVQGFYIFVETPNVVVPPNPLPPVNPGPVVPQNPAEAKIVFSNIRFQIVDEEIFVSWKTNIPSSSRIIWDTASQAEKTANFTYANATSDDKELVSEHRVKIGKLEAGTVHYLRLVSKTDRQTAVSQEIAFVQLEDGVIASIFGASLFGILGDLLKNPVFTWILIIALAVMFFLARRKLQKSPL